MKLWINVISLFFLVSVSMAAPIGAWHADGNTDDSVGNNDATIVNGNSFGEGKFGQAFDLDGVDDFVRLPGNPLSGLANFTYAAWVNPRAGASNLFSPEASSGVFYWIAPDMQLEWQLGGTDRRDLTDPLEVNAWQHVALTREGSTVKVYVNGVEASSIVDNTSANPVMNSELQFGRFINNDTCCMFDGLMDEVYLFDNTLSQTEVAFLMDNGLSIPEASTFSLLALTFLGLGVFRKQFKL